MEKTQIYLRVISLAFMLGGCFQTNTDNVNVKSEVDTVYQELTSGEKSMEKAFKLYEFYSTASSCSYNVDFDMFADFRYRFCTIDDYSPLSVFIVQRFDNDTTLSDKDRYCLESKCYSYEHGFRPHYYLHNEDECILIRRHLLNDTDLKNQCVFNYLDYIPKEAKIGSHEDFENLYYAYNASLQECEDKKVSFEITTVEYDACINSVKKRFEKIVTSGILK